MQSATTNKENGRLVGQFVRKHGIACGGNWTKMVLSSLEHTYPDVWNAIPDDRVFTFHEACKLVGETIGAPIDDV